MEPVMPPAKKQVRELLDRLPDDCTLEDVLYHLYAIEKIGEGLAAADRGQLIPHEQVDEELRQKWLLGRAG
jgi:predicted transcriptional regulator